MLGDDYNFKIITADRDRGCHSNYNGIVVDSWNSVGKAEVLYVKNGKFRFSTLAESCKNADMVYCCGPYNIYTLKVVLLKKLRVFNSKVVIASMGSFSRGALEIKHIKKKVFIKLVKIFGFFKSVTWSVTSQLEREDVKRVVGKKADCKVAEDLPSTTVSRTTRLVKLPSKIKIVFISRINRMKNLLFTLEAINGLSGEIILDIYGPIEDDKYWKECTEYMKNFGSNISWKYKGVVDSSSVINTFSKYHIFVFPSKGENYGHVIFESLAGGCVPIISNNTPWGDFEENKCGNIIELDLLTEYSRIIQEYIYMNDVEFSQLSFNAISESKRKIFESKLQTGYRDIFM